MKSKVSTVWIVIFIIAGIVVISYLGTSFLGLITPTGYTASAFNSGGRINEGQMSTSAFYGGYKYNFELVSTPQFTGIATVAFYKNDVKINNQNYVVPTTDCPPDCNYNAYQFYLSADPPVKGATMCFTDVNNNYRPYCHAWMLFGIITTPPTCTGINGQTYYEGETECIGVPRCDNCRDQVCTSSGTWAWKWSDYVCEELISDCSIIGEKKSCAVGGCEGTKTCILQPTGYGLYGPCIKNDPNCNILCHQCDMGGSCPLDPGWNKVGIEQCIDGKWECVEMGVPNICAIRCVSGETRACTFSDGCKGQRECISGSWGGCIKDSGCIGNIIYIYLIIAIGITLIIIGTLWGVVKR